MNYRRFSIHLIGWLAYLAFETYFEYAWISGSFASQSVLNRIFIALEGEAVLLIPKIPVTYLLLYIVNHLSHRIKQDLISVFFIALTIIAGAVLHRLLIIHYILPYVYNETAGEDLSFDLQRLLSSLLNVVLVGGVAVAANQVILYRKSTQREKKLVKEKLEGELLFLRSQTNPHFLFNTLNNIYGLARKSSPMTAEAILKLSKLLRFMLYESRNNFIAIKEEIRLLEDYIELQKIRFNERLTVEFLAEVDNQGEMISPLILLPFVENSFKHGASEARFDAFITIKIKLCDGHLNFSCHNSKENVELQNSDGNSIGLSNVRRQLELLYPSHCLEIRNEPEYFLVNLSLNLREHEKI